MATNGKGLSRREALKTALGTGALAAAPLIVPAAALGRDGAVAPSDRVSVGGLGIGSRGTSDLRSFLSQADVQFVAVCDVRNERREAIKTATTIARCTPTSRSCGRARISTPC